MSNLTLIFCNCFFCHFLKLILVFEFYHQTIDCWELNFVVFFYAVILVLELGSGVWNVNLNWHRYFFNLFCTNFSIWFYDSILSLLEIKLSLFFFVSMRMVWYWFSWPRLRVCHANSDLFEIFFFFLTRVILEFSFATFFFDNHSFYAGHGYYFFLYIDLLRCFLLYN